MLGSVATTGASNIRRVFPTAVHWSEYKMEQMRAILFTLSRSIKVDVKVALDTIGTHRYPSMCLCFFLHCSITCFPV